MPYKIVEFGGNYSINKDNMSIPRSNGNRHYKMFIEDIALGNDTVEGPDVVTEGYETLRAAAYPSMAEQLDMQYWDNVNGTTTWADAIQAVKDEYPKTMERTVAVGPVPDWVQEEADEWLFNHQLKEYTRAVERVAQYRLADGQEEVIEDVVVGQEHVIDSDGRPTYDSSGEPIMQDIIRENVVTTVGIDPLPATSIESSLDSDGLIVDTEVPNPDIVMDDAQRAAAQEIIDATPQAVIDHYEANQ
jgi:hypothetical protein